MWNAAVPGLHLWKHNWWAWTSWSVYQWEKRSADQPDAGKLDWVLPGAVPRKPGNVCKEHISLPPCACNMRSAGLSPQPAQLVLSCRAAHFACLTKGIWLCFITFYLHSTGHRMGGITISRYNYTSLQSDSITGQDCSLKLASCCQFVHVSYMPLQKQGFRASTKVVENCILWLDTSKVGVVWHIWNKENSP